jgi:hypothetical protein
MTTIRAGFSAVLSTIFFSSLVHMSGFIKSGVLQPAKEARLHRAAMSCQVLIRGMVD